METTGQIIFHLRKLQGLSQRDLAAIMNVNTGHISSSEKDQRKPSADVLKDFADAFGVATVELLPQKYWQRPNGEQATKPLN
jgi:transcriptional regulator with XRE-family HTH domain